MSDKNNFKVSYQGNYSCSILCFIFVIFGFFSQLWYLFSSLKFDISAMSFSILFSLITLSLFVYYFISDNKEYHFTFIYLISTFTLLTSWRISVLQGLLYANYFLLCAFILKILNYVLCAFYNLKNNDINTELPKSNQTSVFEWQLFFIRIFVAFTFIPHFTEKLFSGYYFRERDVQAFTSLGIDNPLFFVLLAGGIEFLCSFAIGCGFLTRIASIGAFFYLIVATYLGHHFSIGFIWASPGGGWEYPMLWSVLLASFAFFGADSFSIDQSIKSKYKKLPKWVKLLMG